MHVKDWEMSILEIPFVALFGSHWSIIKSAHKCCAGQFVIALESVQPRKRPVPENIINEPSIFIN